MGTSGICVAPTLNIAAQMWFGPRSTRYADPSAVESAAARDRWTIGWGRAGRYLCLLCLLVGALAMLPLAVATSSMASSSAFDHVGTARDAVDGACLVTMAIGSARLVLRTGPCWRRTTRAALVAAAMGAVAPGGLHASPAVLALLCCCAAFCTAW